MSYLWSAASNEELLARVCSPEEQSVKQIAEEIKPTGILLHDFVVRCAALGVWPHPSLLRACTAATTVTATGTGTATAASARPLVVYLPLEEPALPPFALPPHSAHLTVAQVDQLPAAALSTLALGAYLWDTGAMRALAWALPACRTLVNVRIIKIGLSSESLRTLIAALSSSTTVTQLSIDYVSVASLSPSDGAAAGDEQASIEPWADLFSAASPLQSVSLRGNRITDASAIEIFTRMKESKTLSVLNLGENLLTDKIMSALAQSLRRNRSLVSLSLQNNLVTDPAAPVLMSSLLKFEMTPDEVKNKKDYGNTEAQGKATFCLGNQTLRHINLNANPLGDAALLAFAEALQQMDATAAAVGGGSGVSGFAILSLIACAGLSADGVREARERFPNACARKIQIDRVLASTDAPAPIHAYFAALQGRSAAV